MKSTKTEPIFIIEKYSHLKFKSLNNPSQLKPGMMVQWIEKNQYPWQWTWVEINEKILDMIKAGKPEYYK